MSEELKDPWVFERRRDESALRRRGQVEQIRECFSDPSDGEDEIMTTLTTLPVTADDNENNQAYLTNNTVQM